LNNQKLLLIITILLVPTLSYFATTHFRKNSSAHQQNLTLLENASAYSNSPTASTQTESLTDNSEVVGKGTVVKILSDDHQSGGDNGSRHQRFILRLDSGQTVLVVHNIDHWTHRDPDERHVDGWLKRNGKIYQ
jgi:uncharacterized protein YdeI (BOF family)